MLKKNCVWMLGCLEQNLCPSHPNCTPLLAYQLSWELKKERKHGEVKATFPPNISIEKFCQSAKRIIGVSSAAVVRDVFATTASFKRCTVLHNAFPVCTTVYVFQANSTRTLALAPSRPLQNTSTHHAVSSWLLDPGRYAVHTKAYYNG